MLRGEKIVYFGNDWNADNKTSSHHVAEHLSKNNKLLYVESPGLRKPKSSSRDLKRVISKFLLWIKGPRYINDNLYVATLFLLPFHRNRVIRKLNRFLIISSIKVICKRLRFGNPIVWILLPHMELVAGSLNEKLVVYYCHDNYEAMPGVDSVSISLMEQKLLKKADIVFAVNEQLLYKIKKTNPNAYLSPHGVDLEHFAKALDSSLEIPKDIADISRPRIGFFGLFEEWIDQKLIKFLAESKPSWSFIFIGRVAVNIGIIEHLPNIYFIGCRDYQDLPAYAKGFDVAIIPYVINDQTLNCNPLKLREYLAAGKSVVSVSVPEICKYSDVVKVAGDYNQFLNMIEFLLEHSDEQKIIKRIDRIADESWESRVAYVSNLVNEELTKRYGKKPCNTEIIKRSQPR